MSQLKNGSSQCLWTSSLFTVLFLMSMTHGAISSNYGEALTKSILYFEAQRSGKLPLNQRVNWRGDSALRDGSDVHVDLTGGYYDAGDNTKFGFPLAFTTTMLAWSSIEMASQLKAHKEHTNLLTAIKWATDYLIKAHPEPNVLYGQVGDGNSDHACWMRPEDMGSTPRPSYRIDAQHPGADLAGETAAAMAAATIAFAPYNATYAKKLIAHAKQLFDFAVAHPGNYQNSISNAGGFYSSSGYEDELLWAAAWLYRATNKQMYLDYLNEASNIGGPRTVFAWDDKFLGAQVLMAKLALEGKVKSNKMEEYKSMAEQFICNCAQKGSNNVKKTHGGLLWFLPWNNLQYTTSASFILSAYSNYLKAAHASINCPGGTLQASDLLNLARDQADYILGSNPKSMSYMVGYGTNYPKRPHHRGASIVSIKKSKTPVECKAGFNEWYNNPEPNPNVLTGGLVGGPDENDAYEDVRTDYQHSEPVLATVAPFVGVLAAVA